MKKLAIASLALTASLFLASAPAFADWDHHDGYEHHDHDHASISLSFGSGPYYGGYYGYPHYYGRPVYYAPPPTVVYEQAPQVVYVPAPAVNANQTSPTFIDNRGRTCREYQSTSNINGYPQQTYGTACLQPDGSWRIVD